MENTLGKYAQMNQLYKEIEKIYHEVAVHFQLSDSVMMILYALCESDRTYTSKDLCDEWSLSKQTVHSAIKKLENDGYVTLEAASENRKNKYIILTSAGTVLIERAILPVMEAERRAWQRFTAQEQDLIVTLAAKHVRVLQEEISSLVGGGGHE